MSQVTRCPACGTSFKVVPDQLRISQGWVRCGQCNEVFDAAQSLREQGAQAVDTAAPVHDDGAAAQELPVAPQQPAPAQPDAPQAPVLLDIAPQWLHSAPPEIPVSDPAVSLDVGFAEYQQAQVPPEESAQLDAPAADPAPLAPLALPGSERLFVALTPGTITNAEPPVAIDAMPLPQRPAAEQPMSPTPSAAAGTVRAPAHAGVSFLRDAGATAPVRTVAAPRRGWWTGIAVLLLLALLLQWVLHARDRLAATVPALRPVLQALCMPFQCSIQPLRRIDAIVIEGSALRAQGEQGYRLSFGLRNRAEHAVAVPALVLSLTDIQEQAVVRRVLMPDALGTPPPELAAHGEWSTSVDLQMADNAGRARVVGYRLDAFYP